jgi:competence protein ComEA
MHRFAIPQRLMAAALAVAVAGALAVAFSDATAAPVPAAGAAQERLVDINRAGRKELMTLPGVGRAEADKIVANRPYLVKTELVTKQVLALGPFLQIKNQVVALPVGKPARAQAARQTAPRAGDRQGQ